MKRRDFISSAASLFAIPLAPSSNEFVADIAIIGGGVGGCAASLAALRNGFRVILSEEPDWLGGQLTSQAVPPDEHPWIERFGGTALYRQGREGGPGSYPRGGSLRWR